MRTDGNLGWLKIIPTTVPVDSQFPQYFNMSVSTELAPNGELIISSTVPGTDVFVLSIDPVTTEVN